MARTQPTVAVQSGQTAARYLPIGQHGVIGDFDTIALVGMDGTIDYLCLPFLDSPSVFAALLDAERGGRFALSPQLEGVNPKQIYLPDSNILLTRFLSDGGMAEISDFMVVPDETHSHCLVRRAKTVRGEVAFDMLCDPRFDYGRRGHHVQVRDGEALFIPEGEGLAPLRLRAQVPLRVENGALVAEFRLRAGESTAFVLEQVVEDDAGRSAASDFVAEAFKSTLNYWRNWVERSNYRGRWREMVGRSALTLKLLTSRRHGSIAAAGTFGLPESIGGERNWDYRYAWIRDASFTLYALMRLGYMDEAAQFMGWIEDRCAELGPDGSLQTMYGLDGRHELCETVLPHFEGYRGSSPVRVGNAAYDQLQLDIYGELMDSVYLYNKYGQPISYDLWCNLTRLLDWVCENWDQKDMGIWEIRGTPQNFLYSRVMCWVALDRGLRIAGKRSFPAPRERWMAVRDRIYTQVFEEFWDGKQQAFVQGRGLRSLDAAALLMPLVKFIGPRDPRWISTLRAIERTLVDDSLVHRYCEVDGDLDGLHGVEGTFSMCSFWYAECLAGAGDVHQARFIFEKMLGYANHLGLYAEEMGANGEQLGNFPQAFTHIGLISAAYRLDRSLTAAGIRM